LLGRNRRALSHTDHREARPWFGSRCTIGLRSGELNLLPQMSGVIERSLAINLSHIVKPWPFLRATPAYKRLPPTTVRFDRAVMAAAKKILERVRPGITQLPIIAKIASISPAHQCHDQTPLEANL